MFTIAAGTQPLCCPFSTACMHRVCSNPHQGSHEEPQSLMFSRDKHHTIAGTERNCYGSCTSIPAISRAIAAA